MGQKARTLFGDLWNFTINPSKTNNRGIYLNMYSLVQNKNIAFTVILTAGFAAEV